MSKFKGTILGTGFFLPRYSFLSINCGLVFFICFVGLGGFTFLLNSSLAPGTRTGSLMSICTHSLL